MVFKSVYLTEEGIEKARGLARTYLKEDNGTPE